ELVGLKFEGKVVLLEPGIRSGLSLGSVWSESLRRPSRKFGPGSGSGSVAKRTDWLVGWLVDLFSPLEGRFFPEERKEEFPVETGGPGAGEKEGMRRTGARKDPPTGNFFFPLHLGEGFFRQPV
ncbi:MAG: hypothetical protein P4L81_00420, partial [Candidatus Pacebacteria bacterium]|nr:hypothetical protein [Candidatus Paceibacterota bacterium]